MTSTALWLNWEVQLTRGGSVANDDKNQEINEDLFQEGVEKGHRPFRPRCESCFVSF